MFIISLAPIKEDLRGKYYANDEEVKTSVIKKFRIQNALIQRWSIAIERNGDYVEE